MRLLAISGSLRVGSYNTGLLRAAAAGSLANVEVVIWSALADIPAYDEDADTMSPPQPVAALRDEIARADAVLIATPEYNASIPGALKNALDWASRPYATNVFRGKRVAVIGASTGLFGALAAQAELRKVLRTIGADVLDTTLAIPTAHMAFTTDCRLRDPELALALRRTVRELLEQTVDRAA